jgi:hypothetical protein
MAGDPRILDDKAFDHLNLNSYPAWALMTKLAKANEFNGRWVKSPDGYGLEDANKKEVAKLDAPGWLSPKYVFLMVAVLLAALFVGAIGVLLLWRIIVNARASGRS